MTKTLVDVEIAPAEQVHVTPQELLEDFADVSPAWHFMDDESRHYADVKDAAGCVLRHVTPQHDHDVDYAFSADAAEARQVMHLRVVTPTPAGQQLAMEDRSSYIEQFLNDFYRYLENRPQLVSVRAVEKDLSDPVF